MSTKVTYAPAPPLKIEATCNITSSDFLRFEDFEDNTCWVMVSDGGRAMGIELSREDTKVIAKHLLRWANDE